MLKRPALIASVIAALSIAGASATAGLIGGSFFQISPGGGRFPDVAYNSVNQNYLVIYTAPTSPPRIAGRLVSNSGVPIGSEFFISDATGGLYGAVTYNAANNEFLVTWDDQRAGFYICGQRIRGSDGALLLPGVGATIPTLGSTNFQATTVGGNRSSVAWSAASNNYMVVCSNFSEVFYQRISNTGVLIGTSVNVSNDADFSGYPTVAWGSNGNQYLAAWDNSGNIYARRVDAATGVMLGSPITMTGIGTKDRPSATYDSGNSRWLVQYNQTGIPGNSYDQYAHIINNDGSFVGGALCMACSPQFEGETLLGCDVAYLPGLGRYLSVYGSDSGMSGQEIDAANGNPVASPVTQGAGFFAGSGVAADPNLNRWLTAFDGHPSQNGSFLIWGRLYGAADLAPPGLVTNFNTTVGSGQLTVHWTNPNDSDFAGTIIRYKLGSPVAHINDGTFLVNKPNTTGSNDSYLHMGLSGGVTYHYAAFTYDGAPNYSAGANASGVPASKGDFDLDTDVDQKDFAHLQNCFSGSLMPYGAGCSDADLDADGDVDGADFLTFDGCMRGANQPPGC